MFFCLLRIFATICTYRAITFVWGNVIKSTVEPYRPTRVGTFWTWKPVGKHKKLDIKTKKKKNR